MLKRLSKTFVPLLIFLAVIVAQTQGWAAEKAEPAKPTVAIIATGGTIAGAASSASATTGYQAAVFGVEKLLADVPDLGKVANLRAEQLFKIGSENMTPDHWLTLYKRLAVLLADKDVAGVVITHGTDTLEETAYFLNLTLKSDKPVVLVGSMRPATAMSADGPLNLYNAVCLAASPEAKGKGVMAMMNDHICPAREIAKTNTSNVDTFRVPDLGYLGYIHDGKPMFYRTSTRKHTLNTEFHIDKLDKLPMVEIVYGFAGSGAKMVDAAVAAGAKGIVSAGVGNGSLSDNATKGYVEAREKGVVVVRASRTGSGILARNGEADDDKLGFVVADTLSPQKARILLSLALTVTNDIAKIQDMFWKY